MVTLASVSYAYPGGQPIRFPDWQAEKGSHWLVTGPSGSGKTTLLYLLSGLLTPNTGEVEVEGARLSQLSERQRDAYRARSVGYMLQRPALLPALTVQQNLNLAWRMAQKAGKPELGYADVGLGDFGGRFPHQLSLGQAQRVALLRAVQHKPTLLLADEPTSALDAVNATAAITLLLQTVRQTGTTLVVASHDARLHDYFEHEIALQP